MSSKFLKQLGIELPIIQAPMAGADSIDLSTEVAEAGGLGSLACASLTTEQIRRGVEAFRARTRKPINLNFFCHTPPPKSDAVEVRWKKYLERYYRELGIDPEAPAKGQSRDPFTAELCPLLEELKPEIVSFHFGLPESGLMAWIKSKGMMVMATATSVREARWLEERGCDAVIAQGSEAGGHRGMFLETDVATQVGTMSLVPQVVDAVRVPVIAAGGIADARGVAAAFALGAAAAQVGTAYLFCPESKIAPLYRETLLTVKDDETVLTNVFSGRPARGVLNRFVAEVGPISELAPPFPLAAAAVGPLRQASEARGSVDFMQMWAGQSAALSQVMSARQLTLKLAGK